MNSQHQKKYNIAIIGCGRISKRHIDSLFKLKEKCNIIALCDNNEERLTKGRDYIKKIFESYREDTPILYTKYENLLNGCAKSDINIDLAVITTPSGYHASQVIAAANVGLNVCTEKPMATRWKDGLSMVKACDEAGVKLFVVKQNRFNPTIQALKKEIENGSFGKIAMITSNVFWQRPQEYYDQDDWRGTWEFDGGALMNQASHYVDLMQWLLGPVESVNCSTATIDRNIEVEDTATVQLKYRSGALGSMAVTMLTYPENIEGSISILGTKGTAILGGKALNKIDHWEFDDSLNTVEDIKGINYIPSTVYGNGHTPFYNNVFKMLGKESSIDVIDGREGLKSLELLIGAYRSAREGKIIHLPLDF